MSQPHWNRQQNCPAVYIATTRLDSNELETSFGISWAIKDVRNSSGVVTGNALRAELAAFKKTLEMANSLNTSELVIVTKDGKLDEQLDQWETFKSQRSKEKFANVDFLSAIDRLLKQAKDRKYWLTNNDNESPKAYYSALHLATSSAQQPRTRSPIATVAIYGACAREGQIDPKASFGVFWSDGDVLNEDGLVDDRQTHFRAALYALRAALKTALRERITRLVILTRLNVIKTIVQSLKGSENLPLGKTVGELITECKQLATKMNELRCEFIHPEIPNEQLDKAKELAKKAGTGIEISVIERMDRSVIDISDEEDRIFPVFVRSISSHHPSVFQKRQKNTVNVTRANVRS